MGSGRAFSSTLYQYISSVDSPHTKGLLLRMPDVNGTQAWGLSCNMASITGRTAEGRTHREGEGGREGWGHGTEDTKSHEGND